MIESQLLRSQDLLSEIATITFYLQVKTIFIYNNRNNKINKFYTMFIRIEKIQPICDFTLSLASRKREMLIDEYLLPVSRKSEFTNSVNRIFDYANAFLELIFGIDARRETNIKFNTLQFRAARNVRRLLVCVFAISNLHCTLLDKERDKSASPRVRSIGFNYTAWREAKGTFGEPVRWLDGVRFARCEFIFPVLKPRNRAADHL